MKKLPLYFYAPLISLIFLSNLAFAATTNQVAPSKTLYQRLGGVYHIAPVVNDFIERLLKNPTLNANPHINAARKRVSKAGLIYRVTSLVCQASGGPEKYTGRSMKVSHKHLHITENEWQAMLVDFQKTLDKYKVPPKEQKELFEIVNKTKNDIVEVKVRNRWLS